MNKDQVELTPAQRELFLALEIDAPSSKGLRKEAGLRAGDPCPKCNQAQLDYDGLLNLSCPNCGYALGGCFT